jgi:ferrous iron transport protein A
MTVLTLADLQPGQNAIIAGFDAAGSPAFLQRLMQLGLLEDTPVSLIRRAPAGDPIEIKVMDYALSLRQAEARVVLIREIR